MYRTFVLWYFDSIYVGTYLYIIVLTVRLHLTVWDIYCNIIKFKTVVQLFLISFYYLTDAKKNEEP